MLHHRHGGLEPGRSAEIREDGSIRGMVEIDAGMISFRL